MKKVKNVIKGHQSRTDLTLLTIIDNDSHEIQFCGDIEEYLKVNKNSNKYIYQEKIRIDKLGVIDKQLFGRKLFLFTKEV